MLTFANLEVALVWPAAILFVIVMLPIPFVSKLVANLIAKIESIRVGGISILVLAWLTGGLLFAYSLYDLNTRFADEKEALKATGGGRVKDDDSNHHINLHNNAFLRRKWLAERNLYIHAVLFILYAALQKIARLVLEKQTLEKEVKAQENEKKNK